MKKTFETPEDLLYTSKHEWVKIINKKTAIVGITDYAQYMMKEIVFVELPELGKRVEQMEEIAAVESVKSVSELFSPLSGEIMEINEKLENEPELVNNNPYGEGWIFKLNIDNVKEAEDLMDSKKYKEYIDKMSEQ